MQTITRDKIVKALEKCKTHEQRIGMIQAFANAVQSGDRTTAANALNHVVAILSAPLVFGKELRGKEPKRNLAGAIQAFTTSSDLADMITRSFDVFRSVENVDNRALDSFKIREFDDGRGFIEILNVAMGLKVEKLQQGEAVKYSKISGQKATIEASEFGGGFQWPWSLIEDRQFNLMMEIAEEMTMGAMRSKAKELYGLLCAAAQANATIPLPGTGTAFEKGITAVNQAAEKISTDLKDEAWMDAASAPMNLYVHGNDTMVAFAQSLLRYVTNYNGQTTVTITPRQINLIPTYNLTGHGAGIDLAANEALLVMPQGKIQYAEKVAPTSYTAEDIDHFATKQTVRMRYAAAVADVRQAVVVTLQ